MNFFQKKNNTIVSFESEDWVDAPTLKTYLNELKENDDIEALKISAKTIPSHLSLTIIELLLTFSQAMIRKGIELKWILPTAVGEQIRFMGWEHLMGVVIYEDPADG